MSGDDLKKLAESAGLGPMEICREADIKSFTTLYKVYNGAPVSTKSKVRVEQAIKRLVARAKVAV